MSQKSIQLEPICSMRMDRHDEANSHFSQFCGHTQKPNGGMHMAIISQRILNFHKT